MLSREVIDASRRSRFDPVQLEVLWSRLISIVEEAETTLVRTSFSPTVGEAADHAAALLDVKGQILAQTPHGLPAFIAILGRTTRTMLEYFPPETLRPGDVLITNDPWICAGHLPDINLLRPIFFKGKLVAFAANTAHLNDVGGRGSAESVDIFEEGLRIPPSKLFRAGEPNEDLFNIIRANSRTPKLIIGDINAQLAANVIAEKRLVEMMEEYAFDDLQPLSDEIQERTERAMRAVIEPLPDGDYHGEVISDGYDEPLAIRVTVRIRGSDAMVDYEGTSAQVPRAINCPFNLTYAETMFPFRCIAPHIPMAEGALRPIQVVAPDGTIVNPRFPAAVLRRTIVIHNAQAAIFQALSALVPDHLPPDRVTAHSGCIYAFWLRGRWEGVPAAYKRGFVPVEEGYHQIYLFNGGQGAHASQDGHGTLSMPDNCSNVPVEVCEYRLPLLFERKEIIRDSGGPGRFRGGCGQRIVVRSLADWPIMCLPGSVDRIQHPPIGLLGGYPGRAGRLTYNDTLPMHPRAATILQPGDRFCMEAPGGGGVYPPEERDPETVARDVADGLVSREQAWEVYRVELTPEGTMDAAATARLRAGGR
ncbi:MAG: hydantoinase B/oxoprolinase family protein [Armatimonadetes bacterium]|nr:hydantoinase B/oxoprolinase family protein [Armatimonadota bacterium]